jgi:hypothetical protein
MNDMQGKEEHRLKIKNPGVFITVLNDNDVLQGRGSGSMQNTGNIRFRTMVEELRPAYVATSSRKEKAKMITSMVQLIQSRQGRFLQRLNDGEVDKLGLSSNTEHFVEMTDAEAAEKAKQAIRYVHYKKVPLEDKRRKKRAAGSSDPPNNNDSALFSPSSLRGGNEKSSRNKDTIIDNNGSGGNTNNIQKNMIAAMILPNIANQGVGIQSQQMASVPGLNNMNSMAQFRPQQLQQAQLGQMLASFQDTTKPFTAEPTQAIGQLQPFPAQQQQQQQQTSLLGTLQPNALQQLTSSLLSTNNLSQPLAATPIAQQQQTLNTGSQNNQQNLQQQQHHQQLNALLQNLLQQNQSQQQNLQSDTIIQSLLHQQQQQQQQLLGALQQQQRLNSTIQTLQQSHQVNSGPQLQQQSQQQQQQQQQQTNPMLALLSNANANQKSPANSALSSFINQSLTTSTTNQQQQQQQQQQPTPQQQQQQQATNSFLSSMLSNPTSSPSSNILLSPTPLAGQVNMGGGIGGQNGGSLQAMSGLGNTNLPNDMGNNSTQSVTTTSGNTKRLKISVDNNNNRTQV